MGKAKVKIDTFAFFLSHIFHYNPFVAHCMLSR